MTGAQFTELNKQAIVDTLKKRKKPCKVPIYYYNYFIWLLSGQCIDLYSGPF